MGSIMGMGPPMEIRSTILGTGVNMVHTLLSMSKCTLDPEGNEGEQGKGSLIVDQYLLRLQKSG